MVPLPDFSSPSSSILMAAACLWNHLQLKVKINRYIIKGDFDFYVARAVQASRKAVGFADSSRRSKVANRVKR